jgi:hypothetical protein
MKRKSLTKFFYNELLRLSKYSYSVAIYSTDGKVIGVGENAYVEVVNCTISVARGADIDEFPGHTEINVDMPTVMNDSSPHQFFDEFYTAFMNKNLIVKYADSTDLDNFKEYRLVPTTFEIPIPEAWPQATPFIKFSGIVQ